MTACGSLSHFIPLRLADPSKDYFTPSHISIKWLFLVTDCLLQSRKAFSSCHQCILFATACEVGCVPNSLWQSHDRVGSSSWTVCLQRGEDHSRHRRHLSPSVVVRPLKSPKRLCTAQVCSKLSTYMSFQEYSTCDTSVCSVHKGSWMCPLTRLVSNLWRLSHRLHLPRNPQNS